jgi:hypothetical protein
MEGVMAHKLEHLNFDDVVINKLTVHSLEMGLYLAEVDFDGHTGFIVGDDNRPQHFHSVAQVKDQLSNARIKSAVLVHQSAYDEMIGLSAKTNNKLEVPIV